MMKNVSNGLLLQDCIIRVLGLILREFRTSEGLNTITIGTDKCFPYLSKESVNSKGGMTSLLTC